MALAQTERLGRLVAQLLDLSRMESGAQPLAPVAFPVRPLLERALEEYALGEQRPVRLRVSVQPGDLAAHGDPERVHQVVANLLDNAVRHSPAEGRVWLSAHATDTGAIRIAVDDEGAGIPPEEAERVFERFYRTDGGARGARRRLRPGPGDRPVDRRRARRRAAGGAPPPARVPHGAGAAPVSALARPAPAALFARAGWLGPGLLALAVAAALALPGHPAGLGLAVVGAGTGALVAAATGARDRFALGCSAACGLLALAPLLRDARWVVTLSLLAALALGAIAGAPGHSWRALGLALGRGAAAFVPGPVLVLGPLARRGAASRWGRLAPVARGLLLAALLLAVFVPLLAAADAAFAEIVDGLAGWELSLDRPGARLGVALLVLAAGGALAHAHATRAAAGPEAARRRPIGRTEWGIALVALDLTLFAFVAVQATVLFGGHDLILRTDGLTYAEHARRGFFELEAVAALTLGVVAATARWARREGAGDERLARALLGLLCVLTLVVLASAMQRLWLYVDAFGATRLRFLVAAQLLWLAALFAVLLVAGAVRAERRLPRFVVALSALAALLFAAADPDRRIAERNVARWEATGRLDVRHANRLSADAAPALAGLPPELAACATERVRDGLASADGLAGANRARAVARDALAGATDADCPVR